MKGYSVRLVRLIFGLFLFALGSFLTIQANIGLASWEAFSMGIANLTDQTYGNILIISGVVILGVDVLLKEKVGFGTILNTILIGVFVDMIQAFEIVPQMHSFFSGVVMLLLGQVSICIGSYFYIGASMGCGPRDALMVALGKRMPNVPIGITRGLIEGTVLLIGWLLGAKVGIGTVISVFGISFILETTFKLLHFDVTNVDHESVVDTVRAL
ncbi:YczE/YyaS/YitT family protein [Enterococcus sp. AZ196]|uniref:YczE/YyaS/YitT family protein n=1 Tax=Enterococcus sp. AZ196 TaxID=2774659 RepID=UPI003D26E6D5